MSGATDAGDPDASAAAVTTAGDTAPSSTGDPLTSDASTTTGGETTAATTSGTSGTSGTTDPGTTVGPIDGPCVEVHKIPLAAADAELLNWELTMSMLGEGEIAQYVDPAGPDDEDHVRWVVEIPCEDTWYIWIRYHNTEEFDSYFARLDGMPGVGEAIFEGDCLDEDPVGYHWNDLNRRDPLDPMCTYVVDPWTGDWSAGPHAIELSFREAIAVARALVVNDPNFTPGPRD